MSNEGFKKRIFCFFGPPYYVHNIETEKDIFLLNVFEAKRKDDLKKTNKHNINKQYSTVHLQCSLPQIPSGKSDDTMPLEKSKLNLQDDGLELVNEDEVKRQIYKSPCQYESGDSFHIDALPSGLFADIEYYMQPTGKFQFIFGIYTYPASTHFLGQMQTRVLSCHFQTLKPNTFVDATIIDASIPRLLSF